MVDLGASGGGAQFDPVHDLDSLIPVDRLIGLAAAPTRAAPEPRDQLRRESGVPPLLDGETTSSPRCGRL